MNKITENTIETFAIGLFKDLGYDYVYGPHIAPDAENSERSSFNDVLLLNRLQKSVHYINSDIPTDVRSEAIKEIQRISSTELLTNNETFHRYLTEGIPVTKRVDGVDRGDRVWLIDFKQPHKNEFLVVNQFTVTENRNNKRIDLLLFINGIPLVVIEIKNATVANTFFIDFFISVFEILIILYW